jgi:gamma-glutamylcyclotransferase
MNNYYFAYGSNMDLNRMKQRKVNFKIIGLGVLKGYELKFNKIKDSCSGYANIITNSTANVEGIVYELESFDQLDVFEGVEKKHYHRSEITVEINEAPILVNVYIAYQNRIKEGLKPRESYLNHLKAGKQYLSDEYNEFLNSFDTIEDDKKCD